MALQKLFHCPNCNAALDYEDHSAAIVRCDYCHSVVIVPETLRKTAGVKASQATASQATASQATAPSPAMPEATSKTQTPARPAKPAMTQEEAVNKVTALARRGQQIEAMKLYRETFPVGLKEAKEAVDQAAAGHPLPVPETRWEGEEDLPLAAAEEITHLAAIGQMAAAARLYRITFDTSQKEAEIAVEQLAAGNSIDVAQRKARQDSQATAVRRERPSTGSGGSPRILSMGLVLVILVVCVILLGFVGVLFFL